jgi:signal transduction histidine kinase
MSHRSKTLTYGLDELAAALGQGGKSLHPMLRKQLDKHVGGYDEVPMELRSFVDDVDRMYKATEAELGELETSLEQSTQERRQASDALQAVFGALPDLLLRLDAAGRVIDKRGDDAAGNPLRKAMLRHMASEYLPQAAQEPFRQAFDRVCKGAGMEQVDFLVDEDGPRRHYEARVLPLRNGEALVLVRDITSRVDAERARARHTQEEARAEAMSQFAYIASHDLRAPLRAIENLAGWIAEDLGDDVEGDAKSHLDLLRTRVRRMDNLLEGLLEYSRVGSTGVTLEDVDLGDVVQGIAEMLGPPEGFTIRATSEMPHLRTARDPLERVLLNLVTNAVKHHDMSTGAIEVSAEEGSEFWIIRVADDGAGIPDDQRERVFEMFQTLKRKKKVDGVGMGLALIKRIIESAGGTIRADDRQPRGAVFEFTWPKKWHRENRPSWAPPPND